MNKQYFVYILTNRHHTVFYMGMTSDLGKRHDEHLSRFFGGFTKKYNIDKLVYFEVFPNPNDAIVREKQLKKWSRRKKIWIINSINPTWEDLGQKLVRH